MKGRFGNVYLFILHIDMSSYFYKLLKALIMIYYSIALGLPIGAKDKGIFMNIIDFVKVPIANALQSSK